MDDKMKPEDVKIIQFQVEPYTWYESNGSMYKTKNESNHIYGLGDNGKMYRYGNHSWYGSRSEGYKKATGWREYTPDV